MFRMELQLKILLKNLVSPCSKAIQQIVNLELDQSFSLKAYSVPSFNDQHNCSPRINNTNNIDQSEPSITIPISYLEKARPFIELMSSYLPLLDNNQLKTNLDNSLILNRSENQSVINQSDSQCTKETVLADNHSTSNTDASLKLKPSAIETKGAKHKASKGKATVITSDKYTDNLIADKLKNIKKEGLDIRKRKRKILSDITKKTSENVCITETAKHNISSYEEPAAKRKQNSNYEDAINSVASGSSDLSPKDNQFFNLENIPIFFA